MLGSHVGIQKPRWPDASISCCLFPFFPALLPNVNAICGGIWALDFTSCVWRVILKTALYILHGLGQGNEPTYSRISLNQNKTFKKYHLKAHTHPLIFGGLAQNWL